MKSFLVLLAFVSPFCFFSNQKLAGQTQSSTGKDIAVNKVDSSALYLNVQQQYTDFSNSLHLNQSSVGVKFKKQQYTLISNFQVSYNNDSKSGWQSANEFYYTPKHKKTYQYAAVSFSNANWYSSFTGAISNYYIGIKNLEIENGLKYISLSDQKDIWMINTGASYALSKNLFTAKWIYLNNGASNNDFILGYRYYFNENSVIALNLLSGDNNVIPEYNGLSTTMYTQNQKYYGLNFNTTFSIYKDLFLGVNYTYNHFKKSTDANSWNLHIASLALIYKLY